MSEIQKFRLINKAELAAKGAAALSNRPNTRQEYGVGGKSAPELKAWFDNLAALIASRYNELIAVLGSEEAAKYVGIKSGIKGIDTLDDLVAAMNDGRLAASSLSVDMEKEQFALQTAINRIVMRLGLLSTKAFTGAKFDEETMEYVFTTDAGTEIRLPVSHVENSPTGETDPTVPAWAKEASKPTYTADEVGADKSGTAASAVSTHNVASDAHNDIRVLITGLANRLNTLANSDDTTLDQMAEVVAYIKNNKSLIDGITTSKVNVTDIVNNLTSNVTNKPLSAAQGVALKALIDAITVPTKTSQLANDRGLLTSFTESDPTVPAWAKAASKPKYTASEVGADKSGTAASAVSTHNVADDAHNDIRVLITELANRLNTLANSDDTTLDQMAEVVAYIKNNKSLIDGITTSKVNVTDIVNNLTSNVTNKPLSAAQGVALKALIDAITVPTKTSQLTNDSGFLTSFTESDPTVPAWAKAASKPKYTASEVGADKSGTAASAVSTHNVDSDAHNDIRVLITELANRLNTLANSDDTTLDQMAEVVAYIKNNKSLIDGITTSKVNVADIVNNLTSNVTNKPLSAAQGVALNLRMVSAEEKASNAENSAKASAASASSAAAYAQSIKTAKDNGELDGYTPQKNVDYLGKEEAEAYIASELAKRGQLKPEFANSVEELEALETDEERSKLYVLLDGYIYANVYTVTPIEPKNAIPTSTDTDRKTIYNGKGYKAGARINSSGVVTDASGKAICVTGLIPAKVGNTIEIKNIARNSDYAEYVVAYNSSNAVTGKVQTSGASSPYNDLTDFDVTLDSSTFGTDFDAVRISGIITANTSVIVRSANSETVAEYRWTNTGHAFVPADYEPRIIELERENAKQESEIAKLKSAADKQNALGISEVFAPSPQLPADGSETADFNGDRDYITAEQIYAYIDTLLSKYPRFITKEVMGKDASGKHDWCRYVCSRRAYDAWQKPNYPPMYAWANGSTVIYSASVSPRIGDTLYTTAYIGTAKGTVTAVSNANQTRTVGGVAYTRDKTKDIAPTLVYTETAYSPYFSSNYAGSKNGVYDGNKSKISTISNITDGTLTDANNISYIRYPLGDRNSKFEEIPSIVIGGNEHGTGGDPATPAMVSARMIKDLCECVNANNPFLNMLKNEYMVVFCPVVNPWGLHKDNKSYYNSNGVNLDRNFDTPGWGNDTTYPQGDYGGSENETQYFMNTLVASKCKLAMCNHSYGHGIDNSTGEAVSGGICSYMLGAEKPKYAESLLKIAEVMAANCNLLFNNNGSPATPEIWAKTRSYIEWIGADAVALEMNSRDGFITDPNNEAQGKQFTARVMEAAYTQLLQVLYMMIDKQEE